MDATGRYIRLRRDPDAAASAREWMEHLLHDLPEATSQDVTLLTHELVTNAVKHADGGYIWVAALVLPNVVRVEVSDEGGLTEPTVLPAQPFSSSGRGLMWVDELSDRWGTEQGRVSSVWFQISIDEKGNAVRTSMRAKQVAAQSA